MMFKLNNLGRKLRVGISDQHDHKELWHMFLSPLKLIGVSVGVLMVLMIIILTLAAYTPMLNLVPGYSAGRQREEMIRNILRVDSIEQSMADIEAWGYDLSLIMEGRTPVEHDVVSSNDSARVERPDAVMPNAADSILRGQMEGPGPYALQQGVAQNSGIQAPVRGTVAAGFDPREGKFGVSVATGPEQQVLAVAAGTVIVAQWTVGEGHTVQVQHVDNLISIYRHLSQSLVSVGSRVRQGEALGSIDQGTELLEFELWQSGNPVNPENYVVF
jgi:hypothetical protein